MRRVAFVWCLFVMCGSAIASPLDVVYRAGVTLDHPALQSFRHVQAFTCERKTCTQIRSCEEACYKLLVCGDTRRDGDNDGIPCENLCTRRCR